MEFGRKVMMMLFIIWFLCMWSSSSSESGLGLGSRSELRNNNYYYYGVDEDIIMDSLISGPNGYCIGEKPITFDTILTDFSDSQMWTFNGNGTMHNSGWCLVTTGFSQGSSIRRRFCYTVSEDATIWKVQNDGSILNPASGLVLTALFGELGTILTLQENIASSFQTWRVHNLTQPNLASIISSSNNSLCIQATKDEVILAKCNASIYLQQRLLLYPDGTIRPQKNSDLCLTDDNPKNKRVVVLTCGVAPSSQRWLFTENSTILTPRENLVMEALGNEIIVSSPVENNSNQKWILLPRSRHFNNIYDPNGDRIRYNLRSSD